MKPVGEEYATRILAGAQAFETGQPVVLAKPELPDAKTWVMFDLEGMPPRVDELEKIYLWGLQVFGENAGPFRPALAGFGPRGDREGWQAFLAECESIFDEHGDIPFVHWATYEQVKIDMYINRYGDPDGIAARVKANLLDLLPDHPHVGRRPRLQLQPQGHRDRRRLRAPARGVRRQLVDGQVHRGDGDVRTVRSGRR